MKKVLMIIANEGFRDEEYFEPLQILQDNSIEVITGGLEEGVATGNGGGTATIELSVDYLLEDEERIEPYDAIVFIGGSGMTMLTDEVKFHSLALIFLAAGKYVAGICVAPVLLGKAGLLRGKQATVFPNQEFIESIVNDGAEYIEKDIVQDGMIITANGPAAAYSFGSTLVRVLSK